MKPAPTTNPSQRTVCQDIKSLLTTNVVTIMFAALCLLGYLAADISPFLFLSDIVDRVFRNSFLVLSLIIPVIAGMGLNFSIVLGAMAGQAVIIFVTHWGIAGLPGILLCLVLVTPLSILLGYLTGKLLNKTKGQEMITGLILCYFAQGVYEFIFLQLVGGVIPMKNPVLVMSQGVGIRVSIDLSGGLKYGLDRPGLAFDNPNLLRPTLPWTVLALALALVAGWLIYRFVYKGRPASITREGVLLVAGGVALVWSLSIIQSQSMINMIRVPVLTGLVILALCGFIAFFAKTKLGQDMRTVGQDRHVAAVAGIDVDRVRVMAIIMSMVMAAWGHIIFLQNIGAFSTYGSHEQVGLYAVAALLIGGATVTKATIGHALLGVFLFHTLFIVSPPVAQRLFGDAQIGEYFRVFVAYGVIGASLAMYAWKRRLDARKKFGIK